MSTTAEPTARDIVLRTLRNLRKIGSAAQQREAAGLEALLTSDHQTMVANFATKAETAQPGEPEGR